MFPAIRTVHEAEARAAELGIAAEELVKASGVSRATWNKWKAGSVGPTWKNWQKVLDLLGEAGRAA